MDFFLSSISYCFNGSLKAMCSIDWPCIGLNMSIFVEARVFILFTLASKSSQYLWNCEAYTQELNPLTHDFLPKTSYSFNGYCTVLSAIDWPCFSLDSPTMHILLRHNGAHFCLDLKTLWTHPVQLLLWGDFKIKAGIEVLSVPWKVCQVHHTKLMYLW